MTMIKIAAIMPPIAPPDMPLVSSLALSAKAAELLIEGELMALLLEDGIRDDEIDAVVGIEVLEALVAVGALVAVETLVAVEALVAIGADEAGLL